MQDIPSDYEEYLKHSGLAAIDSPDTNWKFLYQEEKRLKEILCAQTNMIIGAFQTIKKSYDVCNDTMIQIVNETNAMIKGDIH